MRYYCIMRKIYTAVIRPRHPNYGECTPEIRDTQCAFAILNITPSEGYVLPCAIRTLCYGIPGVGALRVDVDCRKIRILYDGTMSAIAQIEEALRTLGISICHPEEIPSQLCFAPAMRGAA